MENGKRIDAFYNPKKRVILFFGYTRPQMEMEKNYQNYQNCPLCLITSQPTDSGKLMRKMANWKREIMRAENAKSSMDIDYG